MEHIRTETPPGICDIRITISPPRRGYGWLLARERDKVDYEEMTSVLEDCERSWRPEGKHTCGCDECPHMPDCRILYDHKCPKTPFPDHMIPKILRGGFRYKGKHLMRKGERG